MTIMSCDRTMRAQPPLDYLHVTHIAIGYPDLNSIISKSKQATGLKLSREMKKLLLYKAGKLLLARVAQIVCQFENKKN